MESTLELDLLTPLDWRVLRSARLYALLDSPDAFTSSYAHESAWGELEWQRVLDAATWIVAREPPRTLSGWRSSSASQDDPRPVMSSPPGWRLLIADGGVTRLCCTALAEIDRQTGVTELMLWVLEDNHDAQRAYQALGFESTGDRQYLPAFGQFERRLRLEISAT